VKVESGDRLQVECKEEPRLNGAYEVTKDGLLLLPYVGAVMVGGATEAEAADRIAKTLVAQRIVKSATVRVAKIGVAGTTSPPRTPQAAPKPPVQVLGSVKKPGEIAWTDGLRLSDVLRQSEPTADADLARVRIVSVLGLGRTVAFSGSDSAAKASDPLLQPGERVFVPLKPRAADAPPKSSQLPSAEPKPAPPGSQDPDPTAKDPFATKVPELSPKTLEPGLVSEPPPARPQTPAVQESQVHPRPAEEPTQPAVDKIKVLGAVAEPGTIAFESGLTLSAAIRRAGGLLATAKVDQIVLVRGRNQYTCNLDLVTRGLSSDCALQPGDEILVPSGKSRSAQDTRRTYAAGLAVIYFLFGR
jgi:protein involved in polysaccharide export with SLBB domain